MYTHTHSPRARFSTVIDPKEKKKNSFQTRKELHTSRLNNLSRSSYTSQLQTTVKELDKEKQKKKEEEYISNDKN